MQRLPVLEICGTISRLKDRRGVFAGFLDCLIDQEDTTRLLSADIYVFGCPQLHKSQGHKQTVLFKRD